MKIFSLMGLVALLAGCGDVQGKIHWRSYDRDEESAPQDFGLERYRADDPNYGILGKGWAVWPIPMRVDASFSESEVKSLQAAMDTWAAAAGRSVFTIEPERFEPHYAQLYDLLNDQINTIVRETDWSKTGKFMATLGSTIWDGPSNTVETQTDIVLNAESYRFIDAPTQSPGTLKHISALDCLDYDCDDVDLESLALHELGHALGLAHIAPDVDPDSVMNPALWMGKNCARRQLSDNDIIRLHRLPILAAP